MCHLLIFVVVFLVGFIWFYRSHWIRVEILYSLLCLLRPEHPYEVNVWISWWLGPKNVCLLEPSFSWWCNRGLSAATNVLRTDSRPFSEQTGLALTKDIATNATNTNNAYTSSCVLFIVVFWGILVLILLFDASMSFMCWFRLYTSRFVDRFKNVNIQLTVDNSLIVNISDSIPNDLGRQLAS